MFAEQNAAAVSELLLGRRIRRRHVVFEHLRMACRSQAGGLVDVLEAIGDPVHRSPVFAGHQLDFGRLRFGKSPLAGNGEIGMEGTVQDRDPIEIGLGQFDRRKLARAEQAPRFGDRQVMKLIHCRVPRRA